jgi:hypothetical protein
METKEWQRWVNMFIFAMVVVDSWMLYEGCTGGRKMIQTEYYKALIDSLIDNMYYNIADAEIRVSMRSVSIGTTASSGTSGTGLHLTSMKRKRGPVKSSSVKQMQFRCKLCQKKTNMVCSICWQDGKYGDSRVAYCHPTTNRGCFRTHMCNEHN